VRAPGCIAAVLAGCAIASSAQAGSAADEREKCASASEHAQELRRAGKLVLARDQLVVCSRAVCPAVVKRDCARWIGEVQSSLPTVVVTARDADGHDLVDVRVFVDDTLVTEHLDGKAITIDPGPHSLRYEVDGSTPIKNDVVIHEGEKARVLPVRFGAAPLPDGTAGPRTTEHPAAWPVGAYILGGIGVASLAVFTVLAVAGENTYEQCSQSRSCSPSQKDSLGLERGVAWVTLGVGVACLGVAAWFVLTQPSRGASSGGSVGIAVGLTPIAGGEGGALRLSF
jgi:hypothetical protein